MIAFKTREEKLERLPSALKKVHGKEGPPPALPSTPREELTRETGRTGVHEIKKRIIGRTNELAHA